MLRAIGHYKKIQSNILVIMKVASYFPITQASSSLKAELFTHSYDLNQCWPSVTRVFYMLFMLLVYWPWRDWGHSYHQGAPLLSRPADRSDIPGCPSLSFCPNNCGSPRRFHHSALQLILLLYLPSPHIIFILNSKLFSLKFEQSFPP